MKTIISKIERFSPVDDKGLQSGTYLPNQFGELVTVPSKTIIKPAMLPYIAEVDLNHSNDVCLIPISEIEGYISLLKKNKEKLNDSVSSAKYDGYISALNYVVSHSSNIEPWGDFIDSITNDLDEDYERKCSQ